MHAGSDVKTNIVAIGTVANVSCTVWSAPRNRVSPPILSAYPNRTMLASSIRHIFSLTNEQSVT